jgi:hypothetical protein
MVLEQELDDEDEDEDVELESSSFSSFSRSSVSDCTPFKVSMTDFTSLELGRLTLILESPLAILPRLFTSPPNSPPPPPPPPLLPPLLSLGRLPIRPPIPPMAESIFLMIGVAFEGSGEEAHALRSG